MKYSHPTIINLIKGHSNLDDDHLQIVDDLISAVEDESEQIGFEQGVIRAKTIISQALDEVQTLLNDD